MGQIRDPKTGEPLPPRRHPGYYPGYETLSQASHWDEATRKVVLARVYQVPPLRFFTPAEQRTARALFDRLIPQDDRVEERKIPVLNYVDKKLFEKTFDGYRYADMPEHDAAHRQGLAAVDQTAEALHGRPFADLTVRQQEEILLTVRDGKAHEAAREAWKGLDLKHYWALIVGAAIDAYYSHPYAWDEIGFGGPAYPRGYMRIEGGKAEPHEVAERRYSWLAPEECLSEAYRPFGGYFAGHTPGQGGSH
jgi:Gluconate 2-dehydrogenase subunit 3